jgi:hypothetical protein
MQNTPEDVLFWFSQVPAGNTRLISVRSFTCALSHVRWLKAGHRLVDAMNVPVPFSNICCVNSVLSAFLLPYESRFVVDGSRSVVGNGDAQPFLAIAKALNVLLVVIQ